MAGGRRGRPAGKTTEATNGKKKVKEDIDLSLWQNIAHTLRMDSIKAVHVSKSGHPTSCASIAEIMSLLFFHPDGIKFHADNHSHFLNDRFVLSKGHSAPILYACLYRAKTITEEQFFSLRLKDSIIEGHPVPKIPFVDVGTGSLGQGLGVAAGLAYSSKHLDKISNRVYCVVGDGEIAEGSIWEAVDFARIHALNNLITVVDVNRLGQSQSTMHEHNVNEIEKKFTAFGWEAIVVDGHNLNEVYYALEKARNNKKSPTVLVAKTSKGKDFVEEIEGKDGWHGKDIGDKTEATLEHIRGKITATDI